MKQTEKQFDIVVQQCRKVYTSKLQDYGTAWRVLRLPALTDQIYIKANRIRSLQEKGKAHIEEGIENEFVGIINYCVMALIQIELGSSSVTDIHADEAISLYDQFIAKTKALMSDKNHDYDEAWRNMRVSSIVDIILMKLLRVKRIEENSGRTSVSEGVDANYTDIINYAIFALILLGEDQ